MGALELRIPPPVVALLIAATMWGISLATPVVEVPRFIRTAAAIAFALAGIGTAVAGFIAFRRAMTTVNPRKPETSSSLVTSGVYGLTRNPMYVGLNKHIILLLLTIVTSGATKANQVTFLRTPDNGIQPQAALDAKGVVHLIYFKGDPKAGDIFYVRREPAHHGFSKPIQVNSQPHTAMALGTIRGAQLAVGKNGRVHVAWDGMGEGASSASRPFHTDDPSGHSSSAHHGSDDQRPLFYTRLNEAATAFEPERNVITYAYGLDGGSSVAADPQGNVYVTWHAPKPGNTNGEAGRAVFVAHSTDEGKTFQHETPALAKPTGACACCGMKAFADSQGNLFALFRAASEMTNRNETLLFSRNQGSSFDIAYSHQWTISACPMSSASLSESKAGVLAAAETHGRVFLVRVDPVTGKTSSPVSPDRQAKYPVAIGNARGEVLLAWVEGTAWNKGGSVAWQIYDTDLNPTSEKGRADGVAAWSLPTAFADPDGNFTVVY